MDKGADGMQGVQVLEQELQIGADFCRHVVDYAGQASDTVFLQVYEIGQHIGLDSFDFTTKGFFEVADTACAAAHRGSQQLLGQLEAALNGTTIDVSQQASSGEPGLALQMP